MQLSLLATLLVALPAMAFGQQSASENTVPSPCVRVAFGSWRPPLDWRGSGHADSAAGLADRVRRIKDSVYAGASSRPREEMIWTRTNGRPELVIFPVWWPAGVAVSFPGDTLGDTLSGQARALVADLGKPVSVAWARVVRVQCGRG